MTVTQFIAEELRDGGDHLRTVGPRSTDQCFKERSGRQVSPRYRTFEFAYLQRRVGSKLGSDTSVMEASKERQAPAVSRIRQVESEPTQLAKQYGADIRVLRLADRHLLRMLRRVRLIAW